MGESSTYTLTLLQAGRGRHILRVRTNPVRLVSLSAAGGDVEASIIHGGDATGWEVVETDDASNFVTLPATTSGMGRGSLTFSYAPKSELRGSGKRRWRYVRPGQEKYGNMY